ncbi:Jlp1p [Sugiyamaella lignohabitans]|uniref:Jlp1p n=1 Tax=Sugiyamaella lignohabitans TaxID=796027 RepID=A0A170R0D2_9ASCO|nr:Jlp1p [Sugiyamaella lignohabitans]ANB16039.1 Jlp1p [Sugiyamaella lignohabitans]
MATVAKSGAEVNQHKQLFNKPTTTAESLAVHKSQFRFPAYAPTWDPNEKYNPYDEFDFSDPGLLADEKLVNLFPNGLPSTDADKRASANTQLVKFGYSHIELTPKFGSEIRGIQLSQLGDSAKNDLARFVAERGVVVFRDQDFRELPIPQALKWAEHFGRQHIHPTSGSPEGYPEVHLVYRDANTRTWDEFYAKRVSSVGWHSDVTYEKQPPGTTLLGILELPTGGGGDTLFTDTTEIYERLSPEFKKRLHGLKAVHSAQEQAARSQEGGGVVRREPVKNSHPIVRTHPVTKKKSIFVNPSFTRYIEGFKSEESEALLKFLYDTIAKSADTQVRAHWEDGTIVVWDNRRAVHSALFDWDDGQTRHAFRYTPQAERPYETPYED